MVLNIAGSDYGSLFCFLNEPLLKDGEVGARMFVLGKGFSH